MKEVKVYSLMSDMSLPVCVYMGQNFHIGWMHNHISYNARNRMNPIRIIFNHFTPKKAIKPLRRKELLSVREY